MTQLARMGMLLGPIHSVFISHHHADHTDDIARSHDTSYPNLWGLCGTCHLPDYRGREQMPRLAGQREDYLIKALRDYKSGVRAGGGQAAMAEVAHPLSEEEIEALAHYLAYLK